MRNRDIDFTPVGSIGDLAESLVEETHERYAEAVSDEGAPPDMVKAQKLADLLTKIAARDWGYERISPPTYVVTKKTKYVLIDRQNGQNQGKSGFMIVGPGDRVFGTKKYGVPNPRRSYGTLDKLLSASWSMTRGLSDPAMAGGSKEE